MRKIFSLALVLVLFGLPGVLRAEDDAEMTVSQEEKDRICQMVKEKKYQLMEFVTLEESGIDVDKFREKLKPYSKDTTSFDEDMWNNKFTSKEWFLNKNLGGVLFFSEKSFLKAFFREKENKLFYMYNPGYGGRCFYYYLVSYNSKTGSFSRLPTMEEIKIEKKHKIGISSYYSTKYKYEYPESYPLECEFEFQEIIQIGSSYYLLSFKTPEKMKNKIRIDKLLKNKQGKEINIFLCNVDQPLSDIKGEN